MEVIFQLVYGMSSEKHEYVLKVILLGDGGVGKTSLRKRFLGERLQKDYMPTLGADFAIKRLEIDGQTFKYSIWDLAGQRTSVALRNPA